MSNLLIVIMALHVIWVAILYGLLTILRAPKIWNLGLGGDTDKWAAMEPRVSANLSNQFEWPLFFYAICSILISNPGLHSPVYGWLGSLFILGRLVHSVVQIFTENIRLRGVVFTINFLAVLTMWAMLGGTVVQQLT